MRTALISEIVFMVGLAAGRILDLLVAGWPSPMLIAYAVAELVLAACGIFCLKQFDSQAAVTQKLPISNSGRAV
jgi:hypothetical protein